MNKWINVKERVPEANIRVLTFSPSLENSSIGGVAVQWGWCCKRRNADISHWMSLPAPPKEN